MYFGYGANRDPEMMEALLGRIPEGRPAKLFSHRLYIQPWEEIPVEVRKELTPPWDTAFKSYIVVLQKAQATSFWVCCGRLRGPKEGFWMHGK